MPQKPWRRKRICKVSDDQTSNRGAQEIGWVKIRQLDFIRTEIGSMCSALTSNKTWLSLLLLFRREWSMGWLRWGQRQPWIGRIFTVDRTDTGFDEHISGACCWLICRGWKKKGSSICSFWLEPLFSECHLVWKQEWRRGICWSNDNSKAQLGHVKCETSVSHPRCLTQATGPVGLKLTGITVYGCGYE